MFGWIATDAQQQRDMMEAVEQFRDDTTVDDLGLGGIRDSISDTLFPGTSTLHTRIRYALFVPWLLQLAAINNSTVIDMRDAFDASEYQLIEALLSGGESQGVIGRVAGQRLQRTPSSVYWNMLAQWQILEPGFTIRGYFERHLHREQQRQSLPRADDPEARLDLIRTGIHESLPSSPPHLLRSATFELTVAEARFIRESITQNVPDSLLAHLVEHQPAGWSDASTAPAHFSDPVILQGLPENLYNIVLTTHKFAVAIQGVNLLYNYILAQRTGKYRPDDTSWEAHYTERITDWFGEAKAVGIPTLEDQRRIWGIVRGTGRALTPSTIEFVEQWFKDVAATMRADVLLSSGPIRQRIAAREQQKKGARARLKRGNQQALDAWSGQAGTERFMFRWNYVAQHLQDLYDARGTF